MFLSTVEIGEHLKSRVPRFLGFLQPPDDVHFFRRVQRAQTTLHFCELRWGNERRLACIKEFNSNISEQLGMGICAFSTLQRQLEPIFQNSGVIIPAIWDYDEQRSWLIMEFVAGEPFENKIVRSFCLGRKYAQLCFDILEKVAVSLTAIHLTPAPTSALMSSAKSNQALLQTLQSLIRSRPIKRCFAFDHFAAMFPYALITPQFLQRHEKCLVLTDVQAKNILVDEEGEVVMIDIGFGSGHPLLNVAQFVIQLGRLKQRWLLPRFVRQIHEYQSFFLECYFRNSFAYLKPELKFFRLWATVWSWHEQAQRHPWLCPYLRRFYCQEINQIFISPS